MGKCFTDGWKGRIGLIATAPGNSTEAEFNKYRPEGVAVLTTRIPLISSTPEGIARMNQYVEEAAFMLGNNSFCDVVLLSSTAGSFADGREKDRERAKALSDRMACKVITSAECMLKALTVLKANAVTLITPSSAELNQTEVSYLESAGVRVADRAGFLFSSPRDILCIDPKEVLEMALKTDTDQSDALILSCSGLHVMHIIKDLEMRLQKPVIASNQFGLWGALRAIGISDRLDHLGSLFRY